MTETGFFNTIFGNIGRKLKILAKIIFIIGISASIITGIVMFIMAGTASKTFLVGGMLSGAYTTIGFIVIIFGTLLSIISSFCFYGLGEAADKNTHFTDKAAKNKRQNIEKTSEFSAKKEAERSSVKQAHNIDFSELNDESNSVYFANLNQMLLNGQISTDEFEKMCSSIGEKDNEFSEHTVCPYCYSRIKENAEFCSKCGQKLEF